MRLKRQEPQERGFARPIRAKDRRMDTRRYAQREIDQDFPFPATDRGMLNIYDRHNAGFSTPRVELQDMGISSPPCTKD